MMNSILEDVIKNNSEAIACCIKIINRYDSITSVKRLHRAVRLLKSCNAIHRDALRNNSLGNHGGEIERQRLSARMNSQIAWLISDVIFTLLKAGAVINQPCVDETIRRFVQLVNDSEESARMLSLSLLKDLRK